MNQSRSVDALEMDVFGAIVRLGATGYRQARKKKACVTRPRRNHGIELRINYHKKYYVFCYGDHNK